MSKITKLRKDTHLVSRFIWKVLYTRPKYIVELLIHYKKWCKHESYFPEKKTKKIGRIFFDQVIQVIKYGCPNDLYFPCGFNVKSNNEISEYLHYATFMKLRDSRNLSPHSITAVLRDKLLFGMFTEYYGITSSKNLAISNANGLFDLMNKKFTSVTDLFNKYSDADLFFKPINGECGEGIMHLIINDGVILQDGKEVNPNELENVLAGKPYLIQETVRQHNLMNLLHPESINTIRLVTILNQNSGVVEVFPSILRIGTGKSIVDNTSQGGLAVGIELETGKLKEYGFYKPTFGTKVNIHPDSKICFADFTIPFFDECKKQALFLHSMLPSIHSIGWDIAVGEYGPIFIEGNDNWEINGPQICNGGLKSRFYKMMQL